MSQLCWEWRKSNDGFKAMGLAEEQQAEERLTPPRAGQIDQGAGCTLWLKRRSTVVLYRLRGRMETIQTCGRDLILDFLHLWGERLCMLPKQAWFCEVSSRHKRGKDN